MIVAVFAFGSLTLGQSGSAREAKSAAAVGGAEYAPVLRFDQKRDAAADIQAAIHEAQRTGKRVLVDVGGDWCPYCQQMDQFLRTRPDLRKILDDNFITVRVFYSSADKNEKVLSHYPKVEGIPHFFVLDKDGTLLRSQHVLELRSHGAYDAEKMKAFLSKWAGHAVSTDFATN
jgi:thioredoxin-related protein